MVETPRLCPLSPCACISKVLLEHGAVVDKLANDDMTPLHVAAKNGHAKVAKVNLRCDRRLLSAHTFVCRFF